VRKAFRGPPVMSTVASTATADILAEPQFAGK
jgi:hypothetical protein